MADGIRELADDMARIGLLIEDFEGPRFVRLARIRQLIDEARLDDELRLSTLTGAAG